MTIKETCKCGAEFLVEATSVECGIIYEKWLNAHDFCRTYLRTTGMKMSFGAQNDEETEP